MHADDPTGPARGTILVTGGAGFIGCAVSSALADAFERVVALDSMHPQIHDSPTRPEQLDERVELVVGDVVEGVHVGFAAPWTCVLTWCSTSRPKRGRGSHSRSPRVTRS